MEKFSDTPTPTEKINRRRFLKISLSTIGAALIATPGYSFFLERFWVETTKVSLTMRRLPHGFSGIKIVQISDLHLGFYYNNHNLEGIVKRVNRLNPDLICFTGDLVDDRIDGLMKTAPILKKLQASLGKVAIFGNHDFRSGHPELVQQTLIEAGFQFLKNSHLTINRYHSQIHIAGLDDLFGGHPNIEKALSGISNNAFTLLLAHEPDLADTVLNYPIYLQLSGHSHGGQIRVPFFGELFRPDGARHYVEGQKHFSKNNMTLYVNRGIGTTFLPFRFNCRPEITLFTLYS